MPIGLIVLCVSAVVGRCCDIRRLERFDFANVRGLSAEVMAKLVAVQPRTVGQAMRISGVTPAAISLLLVHLKKRGAKGFTNMPNEESAA